MANLKSEQSFTDEKLTKNINVKENLIENKGVDSSGNEINKQIYTSIDQYYY